MVMLLVHKFYHPGLGGGVQNVAAIDASLVMLEHSNGIKLCVGGCGCMCVLLLLGGLGVPHALDCNSKTFRFTSSFRLERGRSTSESRSQEAARSFPKLVPLSLAVGLLLGLLCSGPKLYSMK